MAEREDEYWSPQATASFLGWQLRRSLYEVPWDTRFFEVEKSFWGFKVCQNL